MIYIFLESLLSLLFESINPIPQEVVTLTDTVRTKLDAGTRITTELAVRQFYYLSTDCQISNMVKSTEMTATLKSEGKM